MKVIIEFELDNAAFDECAESEVSRILRDLAKKITKKEIGYIYDINGNRVGHFKREE